MAEFIEVLSPNALKDLDALNKKLLDTVKGVNDVNTAFSKVKTPADSSNAVKQLNEQYEKQQKIIQDLQKKLIDLNNTEKQIEKTRLSEIKLQQQREKAFDNFEKKLKKEEATLKMAEGAYNRVQKGLTSMTMAYRDLAIRKEMNGTLTDGEIKQMAYLEKRIQTFDKALKAVDASTGKYQRNVGNYASAWNPLQNSISQLTREMPAFTYSVQTGFMAISNNLPIFFDAMQEVIAQNKELQAQGKPTKSVLSQLAGAFLSWGTVLSVGITLLTVYGKEIGEFITEAFKGAKGIDTMKESQKQLNDAMVQGSKNAVREMVELKAMVNAVQNVNKPMRERLDIVDKLQKQYPTTFGNLTKEEILNGKVANALKIVNAELLKKARTQAVIDKITENESQLIDLREKQIANEKELNDAKNNLIKTEKTLSGVRGAEAVGYMKNAEDYVNRAQKEIEKTNEKIKSLEAVNESLLKYVETNYKVEQSQTATTNSTINSNKAKEKERELVIGSVEWLEKQISLLREQQSQLSKSSEQYEDYNFQIEKYIFKVQQITDRLKPKAMAQTQSEINLTDEAIAKSQEWADQKTKEAEILKELQNATDEFISSVANTSLSNLGMGSLTQFFDGTFNKLMAGADSLKEKFAITFSAISQVAEEAFNTINQNSQRSFDAEYQRLEMQRDNALMFAGESTEARENIEKQYEDRRRAIQRRQAESEKRMAMLSIALNTARGIMSALAMTPPNIPLSIVIGAIGATQLALTASRQIPEFWKGTDNAPEGWAWTQEKGREIITDKYGNVKTTGSNSGAQLTYLNKGDKVFTNTVTEKMLKNVPTFQQPTLSNSVFENGINRLLQKDNVSINIDKSGFRTFVANGNRRVEKLNNYLRVKNV